jgi:hypothetical protein
MVIIPDSASSLETSATRRMFSVRSESLKPKLLHNPFRVMSPSRSLALNPFDKSIFSNPDPMVVFPEQGKPESQITLAFCLSFCSIKTLKPALFIKFRLSLLFFDANVSDFFQCRIFECQKGHPFR